METHTSPVLFVRNPYSGELLAELSYATEAEVQRAVTHGVAAYQSWRRSTSYERSVLLDSVASAMETRFHRFAELVRDECGKPIRLAEAEVRRAITVFRWASAEALRFGGELLRIDAESHGRPGFGIHSKFPRGLVLGITPFNWPLMLVAHKVAPAIAAGCSILVKPSPATPLSALLLQEVFRDVGAPSDLVQVVLADDAGSASLTRAAEVAMVSFTGSDMVGKIIRAQAPDKPVALELGGNAWVAILDDVPSSAIPAIARRIAATGFGYAGQGCVAVQNIAVMRSRREELEIAVRHATEAVAYGDPRDPEVLTGPLIHRAAADRVRNRLATAAQRYEVFASRRGRGESTQGHAGIVPPSVVVMDDLPTRNPIVEDEIFGPVVTINTFDDIGQLLEQINESRYGLQTGVFTQHWPHIETLYRELHVGGLVVNDVPTARYDHQPYGGVKDSGQGREGVRYAMDEMTESKFLALSSKIVGAE